MGEGQGEKKTYGCNSAPSERPSRSDNEVTMQGKVDSPHTAVPHRSRANRKTTSEHRRGATVHPASSPYPFRMVRPLCAILLSTDVQLIVVSISERFLLATAWGRCASHQLALPRGKTTVRLLVVYRCQGPCRSRIPSHSASHPRGPLSLLHRHTPQAPSHSILLHTVSDTPTTPTTRLDLRASL